MSKSHIVNLVLAWIGALALILALVLLIQVHTASSQGPDDSQAEIDAAIAAEQNPIPPGSVTAFPQILLGGSYPLFEGVDDTNIPAIRMDVTNNMTINAFQGVAVWGAAYDYDDDIVYFNSGSTLWEWPVGGTPNSLGLMVNSAGAAQALVSLAYYNGTLYGTKNIAPEAVHVVNPVTLVVTPTIVYPTTHDMGGFSIDPDTGTMYATDDGSTDSLVIINPNGTVTPVAPYPAGQTDIDGLAVGGGKAYMVTDDANGNTYVYNLVSNAYEAPLTNPWPTSETFAAGAWIEQFIALPGIALTKTVGINPNLCAGTSNITVTVGTDVIYCYDVTNTGDVTLTVHDLSDDQLGTILSGFPFSLTPGASVFVTQSANILTNTVNVASWTACNIDGPPTLTCFDGAAFDVVTATATANVNVVPPPPTNPSIVLTKTVGLDNSVCATESTLAVGQPSTEVYYCYTVLNTGDVTFTLHDLDDDMLGTILSGFPFNLGPGQSTSVFPVTETITSAVTNVATWTAYVDPSTWVTATATATVTEQPTDVSLDDFGGANTPLALPVMVGLLSVLVFGAFLIIRRFQTGE